MHAFINTLIHLYNMRSAKKQKQPLQGGGRGFGNAEKLPERFSSIDDLLNAWAGNQSASNIIKTAKYMGIELRHLGNSTEEINDVIRSFRIQVFQEGQGVLQAGICGRESYPGQKRNRHRKMADRHHD